jgi:hypothetical protein
MIVTSIDYASGTGYFDTMTEAESFIDSVAKLIHPKDETYIDTQGTRIGEKFQLNIGSVFKINGGIKTTSDDRIKIALQLPGDRKSVV